MKKIFFIILFFFNTAYAAESHTVSLEKIFFDPFNKASVARGAKFFATTCMSCHTMIYLRYNEVAKRNGVVYDKMPVNVKWPAGAVPPDLSLEADARGPDWIYTYLHSFYIDPSRPTGANNLLVHNTMMPGILIPLQGKQVLSTDLTFSETLTGDWRWYDLLTLQTQGSMSAQEFDDTIIDVVNFLMYSATPFAEQQHRIGVGVMLFLVILFILTYLLKRQYWKSLKKD